MQRIVPVLKVIDIDQSKLFYLDNLGFKLDWQWQDDKTTEAFFLQISCDDVRLYLSNSDEYPGSGCVYWYVPDVDAVYAGLLNKGLAVDALPHNKAWGNREMQVSDPDGNRLRICTSI